MANASQEKPDEGLLPCSFKFHNFIARVSDVSINCQIIKMKDCLYLWVGDCNNPIMDDLSYALMTDLERHPITSKIMGGITDATSTNMAKRLSMKIGKPVFVSFNITADNIILPGIEKRIQEEFKTHADLLSF